MHTFWGRWAKPDPLIPNNKDTGKPPKNTAYVHGPDFLHLAVPLERAVGASAIWLQCWMRSAKRKMYDIHKILVIVCLDPN